MTGWIDDFNRALVNLTISSGVQAERSEVAAAKDPNRFIPC